MTVSSHFQIHLLSELIYFCPQPFVAFIFHSVVSPRRRNVLFVCFRLLYYSVDLCRFGRSCTCWENTASVEHHSDSTLSDGSFDYFYNMTRVIHAQVRQVVFYWRWHCNALDHAYFAFNCFLYMWTSSYNRFKVLWQILFKFSNFYVYSYTYIYFVFSVVFWANDEGYYIILYVFMNFTGSCLHTFFIVYFIFVDVYVTSYVCMQHCEYHLTSYIKSCFVGR